MKKRISVTLDANVVKHARAMGLNLSYEFNVVLAELVGGTRTPAGIRIMFLERSNTELRLRLRELLRANDNRECRVGARPPGNKWGSYLPSPRRLLARPRQQVRK